MMENEADYIQKILESFNLKVSRFVTEEPSIIFEFFNGEIYNVVEVWDGDEVEIIHAYFNEVSEIKIENFQSYFAEKLGVKYYKVIPF